MDENAFDQIVDRLKKANAVIEKLDPAIRADAFALLRPYVAGAKGSGGGKGDERKGTSRNGGGAEKQDQEERKVLPPDASEEELIEEHESDKESDNALLCLAILLKRHGKGPYPSWGSLKGVAEQFNLDIPSTLHMTFGGMKRDGKEVFRKQADGWKITPSGEKWLKTTYGVERGKEPLPEK